MEAALIVQAANDYRAEYGSFPTGTLNQIETLLSGENPKRIVFVALPPTAGTPKGRFVDPWGTAYSIAFPSESNVTVKSAGKDRILGTPDDIEFQK